ncbi:MAG: outer membrane beta-barrel protein [Bacteroidales bacterium]
METTYKYSISILLFCLMTFTTAYAKSNNIVKGKVVDNKNQPVEFATALLRKSNSDEVVQGAICNPKGEFKIEKVRPGDYTLTISMIGYEKATTSVFRIEQQETGIIEQNITLKEEIHQLKEAQVVAKRKYVEQLADKLVVNPEASPTTASENVFEILKKVPGVSVDNNDNISLKGKQGVKILIDEKSTYVSATQLATILKAMQGKNVDRIEVIENPSARYDAEGNSGIINIKTKHYRAPGFNGSVNSGLTIGKRVGENGGIDLNMNYGKVNFYGNYSYYDWRNWHSLDGTRRFTSPELLGAVQKIWTKSNNDGQAHNFKLGADYNISKNKVLSVMMRGNSGNNIEDGNSNTSFWSKTQQLDSALITKVQMDNHWSSYTYNVNYKWDIDTTGRSLVVDADYALFSFRGKNIQKSEYFDGAYNNLHHDFALDALQSGDIKIFTAKADYIHPLSKIWTIETGLKSSIVRNDGKSDFDVLDETGTIWNPNFNKHDHFIFDEKINAAYTSLRGQFKKNSVQLGLRVENTNTKGNSLSTNQITNFNYTNLFPSIFLQHSFNESSQLGFSYSYRIGRPSYHLLNPFVWILDPYTYEKGNPFLKPQFTHSVGLNHSYKGKFFTSMGFSYTDDFYSDVIRQNDETKVVYQTKENLSRALDWNLSETAQLNVTKWWRLNSTVSTMYKRVNSTIEGANQMERWSYSGDMTNSLSLPKDFELELSGSYQSKMLWGNFYIYEQYRVDLGIQKSILKKQGTLKVAINDIFNTFNAGGYTKYANVDLDIKNYWDSRQVNISFTYRFGKNDFKTRANRTTASSEEQGRSSKN